MIEATVLVAAIDSKEFGDAGTDARSPSSPLPEDSITETEEDLLVEEIRIDDFPIDGMCGVY